MSTSSNIKSLCEAIHTRALKCCQHAYKRLNYLYRIAIQLKLSILGEFPIVDFQITNNVVILFCLSIFFDTKYILIVELLN